MSWQNVLGLVVLSITSVALWGCADPSSDELERNKTLVRSYLEDVVSTGDVDRIERFISPQYVEIFANVEYTLGLEGARDHVLGVRRAFPDLRVTVEYQIAEGDWVATRLTARGTHRGEWMGMRPTGEVLEMTGVNLDRVVAGRIVEHGGAANLLHPLLAAGAVERAAPADVD